MLILVLNFADVQYHCQMKTFFHVFSFGYVNSRTIFNRIFLIDYFQKYFEILGKEGFNISESGKPFQLNSSSMFVFLISTNFCLVILNLF